MKDSRVPAPPVKPQAAPEPAIVLPEDKPLALGEGEKIAIRDFRIEGADFLDAREVSTLLAPYQNRELSIEEVNAAANRVTVLCRSKGYLVAHAYVPKQDVQDGVLQIKVQVGTYGSFQIQNHSLVRTSLLQGVFDGVKSTSAAVTRDSLERRMLLVGDMPGAQLPTVSISPGHEPGSSDFVVDAQAVNRFAGSVVADNLGSRFTGKNRLSAALDVNDPFSSADRCSLSAMTADGGGLQNGRAAYAFPLSLNGLRGELAASKTTYKLGDQYADLNATGVAKSAEGSLMYPIQRSRDASVYLTLNLADRILRDDNAAQGTSTPKRARVATLSVQRDSSGPLLGFNVAINLGGGLTFGRLDIDEAAQKALDHAGAATAGRYSKLSLSLSGAVAFNQRWSAVTTLRAQQALGRNLDGSEQLSISGPAGIKSYPDGVTSDNGFLWNAELQRTLPEVAGIRQAAGAFVDYGAVRPEHGLFTTVGRVAISDVGLAYEASGKTLFARLQWTHTTGSQVETGSDNHRTKVLAQLGLHF